MQSCGIAQEKLASTSRDEEYARNSVVGPVIVAFSKRGETVNTIALCTRRMCPVLEPISRGSEMLTFAFVSQMFR